MLWKRRQKPSLQTSPEVPSVPVEYPAGIAVYLYDEDEVKYYFINKDHKKYLIPTVNVLISWQFPILSKTSKEALRDYPTAITRMVFRDGSLLNNIADGKLYLVSESKLRHVVSPEILDRLGVNRERALIVSDAEINMMKQGAPIS